MYINFKNRLPEKKLVEMLMKRSSGFEKQKTPKNVSFPKMPKIYVLKVLKEESTCSSSALTFSLFRPSHSSSSSCFIISLNCFNPKDGNSSFRNIALLYLRCVRIGSNWNPINILYNIVYKYHVSVGKIFSLSNLSVASYCSKAANFCSTFFFSFQY